MSFIPATDIPTPDQQSRWDFYATIAKHKADARRATVVINLVVYGLAIGGWICFVLWLKP